MLTVDLFSVYLLLRVDIIIRYIEVDFTFGLPDYVRYICIFLWTALDALFFSCWEFTRAYVLFWLHLISQSIYSTRNRIFIIQLSLL